MAGTKRSHEDMDVKGETDSKPPMISLFENFRTELDTHHDRRERIIKASRDITAYSKKVIFALQRIKTIGVPLSDKRILADVARLKAQIHQAFEGVIPDLVGINTWRYQRQISPGIQEYMEAVLFEHYLATQTLMTHTEAALTLPESVLLTYEDYALGLFDMTGELMKISISAMATTGKLPGLENRSVLNDMQLMRMQLELLDVTGNHGLNKDFASKLNTTRRSVEKVEQSVYSMTVRGSERPKGWRPDVDDGPRGEDVEAY